MQKAYRLITPSPGWARILWPETQHVPAVSCALAALAAIPGCQVGDGYAEAPHTAWMLDVFTDLCEVCKVKEPQLPAMLVYSTAWEPAREPYDFQREAIQFACDEPGVLIADDMGLGKTTEAIVAAEIARRSFGGTGVIIAPLMVRDTWRRELLALGAIEDDSEFCPLASRNLNDGSFRKEGVAYWFVHYDIARAWWSKLAMLGPLKPVVAIVDEAHWARNGRTQRAKGTLMLAGIAQRRILLTGTPMDNRPSDLWNLMTIATGARTWGGPLDFRKRYSGATHNGFGWQDGDEPTHVEELRQRIEPFYLRRTADEVGLQLPPMTRTPHEAVLDKARRHEHDAVLEGTSIEQMVRAVASGAIQEVLPALTRLRHITSMAKVPATVEYVNNLLEQDTSAVVFCWERDTVHKIVGRISGRTLAIEGSMSQNDRDANVATFQDDRSEPIILVATMDALREGVTLHRSRIVIMHDLAWVLNHMLQAEKRIHRIGQLRACQSIWMLAKDSIDSILAPTLLRKAELIKDVLNIDAGVDAARDLNLADLAGAEAIEEQVERALRVWRSM